MLSILYTFIHCSQSRALNDEKLVWRARRNARSSDTCVGQELSKSQAQLPLHTLVHLLQSHPEQYIAQRHPGKPKSLNASRIIFMCSSVRLRRYSSANTYTTVFVNSRSAQTKVESQILQYLSCRLGEFPFASMSVAVHRFRSDKRHCHKRLRDTKRTDSPFLCRSLLSTERIWACKCPARDNYRETLGLVVQYSS